MDLKRAFQESLPPKVAQACMDASRQLTSLGIRHAVAGGIAVAAHGYLRATKDVDFLVGEEAFDHHATLVTLKPGIPIQSDGILIDLLSSKDEQIDWEDELDVVRDENTGINVVSINRLVLMKVRSYRRQDQLDVVELLKAGAPAEKIRKLIAETNYEEFLSRFDALVAEADENG